MFYSAISLNQFLDLVIDKQSNSKDHFDEILTGFNLFDYGNENILYQKH